MTTSSLHVKIGRLMIEDVTVGELNQQLWRLRPHSRRILLTGNDSGGPSDRDVFQAMNAARSGCQLYLSLLIVDRCYMAELHHHQAARSGFECDPAHRAPREIISLM